MAYRDFPPTDAATASNLQTLKRYGQLSSPSATTAFGTSGAPVECRLWGALATGRLRRSGPPIPGPIADWQVCRPLWK
jgi:hypothetical protein